MLIGGRSEVKRNSHKGLSPLYRKDFLSLGKFEGFLCLYSFSLSCGPARLQFQRASVRFWFKCCRLPQRALPLRVPWALCSRELPSESGEPGLAAGEHSGAPERRAGRRHAGAGRWRAARALRARGRRTLVAGARSPESVTHRVHRLGR